MDTRSEIKSGLPDRHVTARPDRALARTARMGFAPAGRTPRDAAEIFKKTPYIADLKPGGRDVAKDMFEVGNMPFLMKTSIALPQDGDVIEIDAVIGTLNVKLSDAELVERKTKWKPRETNHTTGALWKYAQQVGPAVDGAVTHPGGAHEKQCYANI